MTPTDHANDASAPSPVLGEQPSVSEARGPEPGFRWGKLVIAFIPLAIIGGLMAVGFPLCPAKGVFGIPCPGCGLTRATVALAHGDLFGVLRYHPLAPLITPMVVFSVFRVTLISGGALRSSIPDPLGRLPKWFWTTLAIAMAGLWAGRLMGLLGGHPDGVDFTSGWLYRVGHFVFVDLLRLG